MPADDIVDINMKTRTLYLTTLDCPTGEHSTTFAHEGPDTPVDMEAPWPDIDRCPVCGTAYPEDLAVAIAEVAEAKRIDPTTRTAP